MNRKRLSSEEITRKLREADHPAASGEKTAQICEKPEISAPTLSGESSAEWGMQRSIGCGCWRKKTPTEEGDRRT